MSKNKNVKEDITNWLEESKESEEVRHRIRLKDSETVTIDGEDYTLVENYREGFNVEGFTERYQDYFSKFPYIVGDWAADQLRLRGFYEEHTRRVPQNQTANLIQDYLLEYCNFGCAYFVLRKEKSDSSANIHEKGHTKSTSWGRKRKTSGKSKRKPKSSKHNFEIQENKPPQSTRPASQNRRQKGNFTIINRGNR